MLAFLLIPLIVCIFNIYRRFTCIIKIKITIFTITAVVVVSGIILYIAYLAGNTASHYIVALSWILAFMTSLLSAGISEKGFVQPWNIVSKIYKWEKLREVSIEKRKTTVLVSFKIIRELRQEYDLNDLPKIKKMLKENTKFKI
ncbi:MAG: hypothetical protein PT934_03115 [Peptoniphilaceae bacterium]|uniref:hypothetical protein n=1 Tax=Parvimonas sp. TaxID=1944660 RepID=UPI0025EB5BC9|nr:hypothetical protein [Parvimonas sp.]MCI5996836.1 hypothetical protein [Parvimonas sp.]MDD7764742.1 hypothetical protein [Peptoniphilaceae bacterium]MDY3050788.1 hypothetical protein [Parvimonas sp.]